MPGLNLQRDLLNKNKPTTISQYSKYQCLTLFREYIYQLNSLIVIVNESDMWITKLAIAVHSAILERVKRAAQNISK